MKTKDAFCANEQEITEHKVTVDVNGEFLFTCDCGRFFKLPGDLDKKAIDEALILHEDHNKGQVSQEEINKINEEKLKNI